MTHAQSVENYEQMYIIDDGSISTGEIPATTDTQSSQPLLYVENPTFRQQTVMVGPQQLAVQDRNTLANCPGCVRPRNQIICFQCHEINDPISLEC